MHAMDRKPATGERSCEGRVGAHGHCSSGVAMVCMFQSNNLLLFQAALVVPVLQRHLEPHLNGGRTIIGEKNMSEGRWNHGTQLLRKLLHRPVRKTGQQDVIQLLRLGGNRFGNMRMAVSMQVDPPRRNGVDDFSSAIRVEVGTLRRNDPQRVGVTMLLREWMPNLQPGRYIHRNASCRKDRANTLHREALSIFWSSGTSPI